MLVHVRRSLMPLEDNESTYDIHIKVVFIHGREGNLTIYLAASYNDAVKLWAKNQ